MYRGRFAPSPTGPLHAGSMVAALASWLDARAHRGTWLVRIEDVDRPRCQPGMGERILSQLADCGLVPDERVVWQSQRSSRYQCALDRLMSAGTAYPCGCTRTDIARALAERGLQKPRHGELVYPGTCRDGLHGKPSRAVRLRTGTGDVPWTDRRLGPQHQDVASAVGDFILFRADGLWAYQLAVVVDDEEQRVTHVVRGEDLADNTPRQVALQQQLGYGTPAYLHTPLVCDAQGNKLSKQTGAMAVDTRDPMAVLRAAAAALGLPPGPDTRGEWFAWMVAAWRVAWP